MGPHVPASSVSVSVRHGFLLAGNFLSQMVSWEGVERSTNVEGRGRDILVPFLIYHLEVVCVGEVFVLAEVGEVRRLWLCWCREGLVVVEGVVGGRICKDEVL